MRVLITLCALMVLSACDPMVDQPIESEVAQHILNNLVPACRDGKEYLVTPYDGPSQMVVATGNTCVK